MEFEEYKKLGYNTKLIVEHIEVDLNNFKEKVRNSLNGKTVNNTTMPNTTQAKIQNKVKLLLIK